MPNTLNAVGASPLTAHGVLVGEGTTTPITSISPGAAGQILTSAGIGVDPSFQPVPVSIPETFVTDSGNAVPAANTLTIAGTHNINTSGAGSTVTVANNNTATFGDLTLVTSGNPSMTLTTGDLTISGTGVNAAGNINLPNTNTAGAIGEIKFGGNRWISNFGTGNAFVGQGSGNTTLTGDNNIVFGTNAATSLTSGRVNTVLGNSALGAATSASNQLAVGVNALDAITTATQQNVAIGDQAGNRITDGIYNTFLGPIQGGQGVGHNYTSTESSNILISNIGTLGESHVMRLGTTGVGDRQVSTAFMAGTYGVTPAGASIQTMVMDSSGQMGTSAAITGFTWSVVTGATQAMAVKNGYVANRGAGVTFTLPATAAVGDIIEVANMNAGGWVIAQNAGQSIKITSGDTTVGVGGSLASTANGDCVRMVCNVANTNFVVLSSMGNITVV